VPYAVNVAASEASETVRPFLALVERLGALFTAIADGIPESLEISYEGEIADYDCRVLSLAILRGVLSAIVDEPVSFVNAPQLAEERGLNYRETMSTSARDYVNLVTLRGRVGTREVHVAGTLVGQRGEPRIVGIDDHVLDVPPAAHMLVVRNADVPGMIGRVGTIVGNAGLNIEDMRVGKGPTGEAALMVLTTTSPVTASVVDELRAERGVVDARAIELE
jgi:D-3-phosphoglycerate dehydrogenase